MKEFIIEDKTIKFPESWNEVTLKQFIKFMNWQIQRPEKFDYDFEEVDYNLRLITIFSFIDLTEDDLYKFKLETLEPLSKMLSEFILSVPTFDKGESLVINGVQYAFVDLDEQLSTGEWMKFQEIKQRNKNVIDCIPQLLAILCRPATKRFDTERRRDVYDISEFKSSDIAFRSKMFEDIEAFKLMGAVDFFLSGRTISINNSLGYMKPRGGHQGVV